MTISGGTAWTGGASISLVGKNSNSNTGECLINVVDSTNNTLFHIKPNGDIYNSTSKKYVAYQEDTVPRSGGFVLDASLLATQNAGGIGFGAGWGVGGSAYFYRGDYASETYRQGCIYLQPYFPDTNPQYKTMRIAPNGGLSWDGTAIQYTSDKRLKQQISKIDNALLDAWQDVEPVQFKYNDAVEQKGNTARLHTGYVVQQIDTACKSHNVDISEYGLYCHEEYPERTEEVIIENEDGTTSKETKVIEPAKEYYSLRYTETLVVECAYLRRENKRLNDRLTTLEELFKQYIAK